jgi:hypothetical protein
MAARPAGKEDVRAGALLVVIHDFVARSDDELSLAKGDRIELIEKDDDFGDGWYLGRHLGNARTGLFPEGRQAYRLDGDVVLIHCSVYDACTQRHFRKCCAQSETKRWATKDASDGRQPHDNNVAATTTIPNRNDRAAACKRFRPYAEFCIPNGANGAPHILNIHISYL